MAFDGNGNWTSPFYPVNDRDNGVAILASKFQTLIQSNLKESFEKCILRDGTGKPTTNINWNGQKITNLASGTSSADAVNKYQLDTQIATCANADLSNLSSAGRDMLVPVGAIQMGPVQTMAGYLLCNGQAVSRTDYSDLFAAIGTNFGIGDNNSTFNVPDYRGCFLRAFGGDSALDMYTKQAMAAPDITGYVTNSNRFVYAEKDGGAGFSSSGSLYVNDLQTGVAGCKEYGNGTGYRTIAEAASRSNSVYGAANEVRPVNYAVNFFIKY